VAEVEQPRLPADGVVLRQDAGVLDRHLPPAKGMTLAPASTWRS
jgi:hypothetical protein